MYNKSNLHPTIVGGTPTWQHAHLVQPDCRIVSISLADPEGPRPVFEGCMWNIGMARDGWSPRVKRETLI